MDTDDRLIFTPNSWKWVDEKSECEPVGDRSDDEDTTLNIERIVDKKSSYNASGAEMVGMSQK